MLEAKAQAINILPNNSIVSTPWEMQREEAGLLQI